VKAKKAAPTKTKKHPVETEHDENEDTVISAAAQLRMLKQKIFCNKHDTHCYIDTLGEHRAVAIKELTYWAKEIVSSQFFNYDI